MSDVKTFEEYHPYLDRKEKHEQDLSALENDMEQRLKLRDREVAKYPDDKDLVDWYNKEKRDLLIWFHRDIEDMQREFIKANLPR